eukprot:Selendium_serpulae@DN1280_c0_g1_i1.p1
MEEDLCMIVNPSVDLGFAGSNSAMVFVNEILNDATCYGIENSTTGIELALLGYGDYLLIVGDKADNWQAHINVAASHVDWWFPFFSVEEFTVDVGTTPNLSSGYAILFNEAFEVLSSVAWGNRAPKSVDVDFSRYGGSGSWTAYPLFVDSFKSGKVEITGVNMHAKREGTWAHRADFHCSPGVVNVGQTMWSTPITSSSSSTATTRFSTSTTTTTIARPLWTTTTGTTGSTGDGFTRSPSGAVILSLFLVVSVPLVGRL